MWQVLFKIENQNSAHQYFNFMFSEKLPQLQTQNEVDTEKLLHCSYLGFGKLSKLF